MRFEDFPGVIKYLALYVDMHSGLISILVALALLYLLFAVALLVRPHNRLFSIGAVALMLIPPVFLVFLLVVAGLPKA
ncbi:hypothetical protein [Pseudogulbenkiania subflava]|uniref:Uncharacterized protein n=1 Tax=Pseudogulbenkiania subflava DSM 22618 TaxID=1123014 RepID=A0A1Y6BNX5_9NEIS|nr:hypothetical protein [Pseudogulbenkiania subflava]SMF12596.1 hypothetical protein SAMN02745746_01432 [Pseudogulbenkiania subflava DSM 22618]